MDEAVVQVETPKRITRRGNPANLKPPWPKGVSGNPSGRPKKKPITQAYEKLLEDPEEARLVAEGIVAAAKAGDVQAAREIADRLEGRVPQQVAVEGQINVAALVLAAHGVIHGNGNRSGGSQ